MIYFQDVEGSHLISVSLNRLHSNPEPDVTPNLFSPGLVRVHGNQPEALRDLIVSWMQRYPLAPLEHEIILTQSNGIAQWLKFALAADPGNGGLGIAAAVETVLPARFIWRIYRTLLGRQPVPETSPFDKPHLIWRLLRLLPSCLEQPDYAPLQRFLSQDTERRKGYQLAERLADLFDQYQVYRADWLAAWANGDDVLIEARGGRVPLPDTQRWQAALWRALLADVEATTQSSGTLAAGGRAAVHAAFLRRVADWPDGRQPRGLPRRVMVFGISSLPRQSLEVLAALARWTQILMCIHNPCEHYWADIVADKDLLRVGRRRQLRRAGSPEALSEATLHLHAHPLLAAWGKQGRDFIGLLDEQDEALGQYAADGSPFSSGQRIDLFFSPGTDTLLHQLQDDIRDLRPLAETRSHWPAVDPAQDRSIRFHIAHSPQREVEILHDRLLAALNADATLTPRDIIVMVPDIDPYAAHIQAVFSLVERDDPRFIPYSIADQGQRTTDPVIHAVEILLGLPQSRLAVSDLLDLLAVPAVRRRLGIKEDALPQLQRWIRGANIRWGLHAEQRVSLGLPAPPEHQTQHTWAFGLRRMLLGYAVGAQSDAWHEIEPYDEIGGLEAALVGSLVLFIERLDAIWRMMRTPATVAEWCLRLRSVLAEIFAAEESAESFTLLQLDSALQDWQDACDEAGFTAQLPVSIVAEAWLSRVDDTGLMQRFLGGTVTFATLMPMRAIPFRMVCLLGMNDGDYPRARIPMDFDLMGNDYRPGDRSRREDDRYLFLEALLSARDHLHLSWVGRSITDNSERPPSVLVGQLRDHLAAGWRLAGDPDAELLPALTQEHRLQPFSTAYFAADAETSDWFTYAREWRPDTASQTPTTALRNQPPLPPPARDEPLRIQDLANCLKAPVKTFFRQRLGVFFERDDPVSDDQEPFALDGLRRWQLRDALIHEQIAALEQGESPVDAGARQIARIVRRGDLAAGAFGDAIAEEIAAPLELLLTAYQKALSRWPQVITEEVEIRFQIEHDGQTLELNDWLGGLRRNAQGDCARVVLESSDLVKDKRYRGKKLIRHWVAHLAGHLHGGRLTTLVISPVGSVELTPLEPDVAQRHVSDLLQLWHDGMRRPLPLAVETGFVWLKQGAASARSCYEGSDNHCGELDRSPDLARVYPDFDTLTASDEFAELAERLLRPIAEAMPVQTHLSNVTQDV